MPGESRPSEPPTLHARGDNVSWLSLRVMKCGCAAPLSLASLGAFAARGAPPLVRVLLVRIPEDTQAVQAQADNVHGPDLNRERDSPPTPCTTLFVRPTTEVVSAC